jgi:hypothetical protein
MAPPHQTWPVRWRLEHGAFTREQLAASESGGSDAALLVSFAREGEAEGPGAVSLMILSLDGRTGGPIPPRELFHAWHVLGEELYQRARGGDAPAWLEKTLRDALEATRAGVTQQGMHYEATPAQQAVEEGLVTGDGVEKGTRH